MDLYPCLPRADPGRAGRRAARGPAGVAHRLLDDHCVPTRRHGGSRGENLRGVSPVAGLSGLRLPLRTGCQRNDRAWGGCGPLPMSPICHCRDDEILFRRRAPRGEDGRPHRPGHLRVGLRGGATGPGRVLGRRPPRRRPVPGAGRGRHGQVRPGPFRRRRASPFGHADRQLRCGRGAGVGIRQLRRARQPPGERARGGPGDAECRELAHRRGDGRRRAGHGRAAADRRLSGDLPRHRRGRRARRGDRHRTGPGRGRRRDHRAGGLLPRRALGRCRPGRARST